MPGISNPALNRTKFLSLGAVFLATLAFGVPLGADTLLTPGQETALRLIAQEDPAAWPVMSAEQNRQLYDKAAYHYEHYIAHNLAYGQNVDVWYWDRFRSGIHGYTGVGDGAFWTAHYLVAMSLRYSIEPSPELLLRIQDVLDVYNMLTQVSGRTGYLARFAAPAADPYYTFAYETSPGSGVPGDTTYPGVAPWEDWFWRGDSSRDMYIGWAFGMTMTRALVSDAGVQSSIQTLVERVGDRLVADDFVILDGQGNAAGAEPWYEMLMRRLLLTVNPTKYAGLQAGYDALVATWAPLGDTITSKYTSGYYASNLTFLIHTCLCLLEDSPTKLLTFKDILTDLYTVQANSHLNPEFAALYMYATGDTAHSDARAILQGQLLDFPEDKWYYQVDWRLHPEVEQHNNDYTEYALLARERVPTDFHWQRSPCKNHGGSDVHIEFASIDMFLPYWFGRVLGVIPSPLPASPDLIPRQVTAAPFTRFAGEAFTALDFSVENFSSAAWSGSITANFYASFDTTITASHPFLGSTTFSVNINPGETVPVTGPLLTVPEAAAGARYVGVILDVADAHTYNNTSSENDVAEVRLWGTPLVCADPYESDDDSLQAQVIPPGAIQTRSICPAGDADWIRFDIVERSKVFIETSGAGGDTVLTLYDGSLAPIASDDNGGEGSFSRIIRDRSNTPAAPGTYYVRVTGSSEFTYYLHLTAEVLRGDELGEDPEDEAPCIPGPCPFGCSSTGVDAGTEQALRGVFALPIFSADPDTSDADDNGMLDVAQLRLVDAALANPSLPFHCCVLQAYETNQHAAADYSDAINDFFPAAFLIVPRDLFEVLLAGLMTQGEPAILELFFNAVENMPGAPVLDMEAFDQSAGQYLASFGDPDFDGVCNYGEYTATVTGSADINAFVAAAFNGAVSADGGGCLACTLCETCPTDPPWCNGLNLDPCPDFHSEGAALYTDLLLNFELDNFLSGGGIPDSWEVALFEEVVCHRSHALTEEAVCLYRTNLALLRGDAGYAGTVPAAEHVLAAMATMNAELAAAVFFELGIVGTYEALSLAPKVPGEPFSEEGDPDNDGLTNLVEYNNTVAAGRSQAEFVEAALDDTQDGSEPPVPLSGAALLVLVLCAASVRVLRPGKTARN